MAFRTLTYTTAGLMLLGVSEDAIVTYRSTPAACYRAIVVLRCRIAAAPGTQESTGTAWYTLIFHTFLGEEYADSN